VTRRGYWLFVALCLLWGLPYLFIKVAVTSLSPAALVFMRTAIGSLLLLPWAVRGGLFRTLLARWWPIVLYSVIEVAIPWLLLSDAERRISSSLAGLLVAAVPLVGVVVGYLAGSREPIGRREVAGLVVGLAGVAVLLGGEVSGGDRSAVAAMTVVVLCYAIGPAIIARKLADLPSLPVVTASLVLCALGYAPVAWAKLPRSWPSLQVVAAVLILGVLCTALAFVVFFRLIAEVGPVRATVVTYFNPAVAVVLGVAVLGEPFTRATAAGFLLILGGSFLGTWRKPERRQGSREVAHPASSLRRNANRSSARAP